MNHAIKATAAVSDVTRRRYPDDVRKIMRERLARQVAEEILQTFKPESRVSDYGFGDVEHTLDLVVFTRAEWEKFVDDLWKKGP